jgi:hypothetical protein
MLGNKAVDQMTDHRIDMILLAITVDQSLFSLSDSSAASSAQITTSSSCSSVTSSGKIARTHSP